MWSLFYIFCADVFRACWEGLRQVYCPRRTTDVPISAVRHTSSVPVFYNNAEHTWSLTPHSLHPLTIMNHVFQHVHGHHSKVYEIACSSFEIDIVLTEEDNTNDNLTESIRVSCESLPTSHIKAVSWQAIADWYLQVQERREPGSYIVERIVLHTEQSDNTVTCLSENACWQLTN